jgi:hypothetical protein
MGGAKLDKGKDIVWMMNGGRLRVVEITPYQDQWRALVDFRLEFDQIH